MTQSHARRLFERYPKAAGLRWWSTFEALWMIVTLFDRAAPHLRTNSVNTLTVDDGLVGEAPQLLGI